MLDRKRILMNDVDAGSGKITETVYRRFKADIIVTTHMGLI